MSDSPISPDIPLNQAWMSGNKIYIHCGYGGQLNRDLRNLGAKWDSTAKALWLRVGTVEAEQISQLLQEQTKREQEIITRSGRIATGAYTVVTGRLFGQMFRAKAERRKPQPGSVHRLRDGRRVMVLSCDVEFWAEPDPGWYFKCSYAIVSATATETAADLNEAAALSAAGLLPHEIGDRMTANVDTVVWWLEAADTLASLDRAEI